MNWNAKIFSYCERGHDASFWAEPLNALTNSAFILAALAGFILWVTRGREDRRIVDLLLVLLVFVIGVGSFLFHTYATRWAGVADAAPIAVFMICYFAYALNRYLGVNWFVSLLFTGVFYAVLLHASEMRCDGVRCLNGSLRYVPAFFAMVGIGAILALKRHPAAGYLLTAGSIFALSLWLRTVDRQWCAWTAEVLGERIGTHFMWHVLNALLLYLLVRCAILHGSRR